MSKNKIPIWANLKDYPYEIYTMVSALLTISDRDYQMRVWYRGEGPEVDWYYENSLGFDLQIEFFRKEIREKKINLTKEQIKAVLRVYAMCGVLERRHDPNLKLPEDPAEQELHIINLPYWDKIRKQAEYALSLLRLPDSAPRVERWSADGHLLPNT